MSHKRMKKENSIAAPGIDTEIWIDYMEGEVDKSFREDLDLVLANNPQEKKVVERLERMKSRLKENEQALPPDIVFQDLKSVIMAEVVKTQIEPVKKVVVPKIVDEAEGFKDASYRPAKNTNRNYF